MDLIERHSEEIDAYVHGRMDDDQQRDFEQLMDAHPELRKEVTLIASYAESFQRKDLVDFKSVLEEVASQYGHSSSPVEEVVIKKFRYTRFLLAAAIVGLLVTSAILWNQHPKDSYHQFAQVVVPFTFENTSYRKAEMNSVDSLYFYFESMVDSKNMERSQLQNLVESMEMAGESKHYLRYREKYQKANHVLLARAYLLLGKPNKTLELFDNHWPQDDSTCFINYYRSVAVLELGRKQEAGNLLQKLVCPEIAGEISTLLEIATVNNSN